MVKWHDPEFVERLLFTITGLSAAVTLLFGLGELLGWWNDLGEAGMTTGTFVTVVVGGLSISFAASRRQGNGITQGVATANATLLGVDAKLGALGKLDRLDTLDTMDARLETIDTKLDELDLIQAELDVQTGALKEQTLVLREIRDRL